MSASGEAQLGDKLRKIEALFAGAGTDGERLEAAAALERVRAHLADLQRKDAPVDLVWPEACSQPRGPADLNPFSSASCRG